MLRANEKGIGRPGDFPIGSLESRAAGRAMLIGSGGVTKVCIDTGLPSPWKGQRPVVEPPDSVTYYRAPDDSIVQVITREFRPGEFVAHITQTGTDGSVYGGSYVVRSLEELEMMSKLDIDSTQAILYPQR